MNRVLAIVGPTAIGKSALGLGLALDLEGEIVNADALQVYRGLTIGTAKPRADERALVPHHLIDIKSPTAGFSAGEFARLARVAIDDIHDRHKFAVVVGGSGLYLKALLEGINEIPEVSVQVRNELRSRLEVEGLAALRAELARIDPRTEARLASGDTQRVLRALEVAQATGRPLSDWIAEKPPVAERIPAHKIGLTLERSVLYDRIRARVESMVESGWLREVESLLDEGCSGEEPAFQAIGYRQIVAHLAGSVSLEEALDEIIRATRKYAKRQMTWFRKDSEITWYDAADLEQVRAAVIGSLVS